MQNLAYQIPFIEAGLEQPEPYLREFASQPLLQLAPRPMPRRLPRRRSPLAWAIIFLMSAVLFGAVFLGGLCATELASRGIQVWSATRDHKMMAPILDALAGAEKKKMPSVAVPVLKPGVPVRAVPVDVPVVEFVGPPLQHDEDKPVAIQPDAQQAATGSPDKLVSEPVKTEEMSGITLSSTNLDPAMVPSDAETEVLTPEPEPVEAKKAPAAHAAAPEPKLDMAKLQPYHAVAPHIDSKAAADLIDRAQTAMAQSDFAAASVLYDLALKQDDENREALLGKATATSRLGNYAGAAQAARHVLTLYPEDREARADLITALSLIASPKAVAELKKMAQATPNQAFLQAAVAQGLSRSGKPDQALPYQYRAATLEPQNILYRHALAVLYDRTGHMAEARDLYQEVLQASTEGDTHALPPDALNGVKARLDYLTDMLNKPQDVAMSDDKD